MSRVLGISVGSRTVGIAILSGGNLLDCRIRTFHDKWSEDKLKDILDAIQRTIRERDITAVGLKAPLPALCSENIRRITEGIQALCSLQHIEVVHCPLLDMKRKYTAKQRTDKGILVSALAFKYPELISLCTGSRRNKYKDKLFEAVECAERAIEETGL